MSIKWPKKYETNEAKNMNYFCIPGNLQIEYEKECRRNGYNVHQDLKNIIEQRLVILKNKDRQLEEIEQKIIELQRRKDLIENEKSLIMTNEKLLKIIDERIEQIIEGTTYQWIYAIIKNLSHKNAITFNEMLEIFCKRAQDIIKMPSTRKEVLHQLKFVGDHANNGLLTDEQINEVFPRQVIPA